jgi:hypothetical protein
MRQKLDLLSVLSNILFKGLPSRLGPFGLKFNIIFGILLFLCRSRVYLI